MSQSHLANVPLIGALCVDAGLVTQEDIEICLTLQQPVYPGTPIGQILMLKGYLTQLQLARMVAQQHSFRRTFCSSLDNNFASSVGEPPVDAAPEPEAPAALPELGSFTAAEVDDNPLFGATS